MAGAVHCSRFKQIRAQQRFNVWIAAEWLCKAVWWAPIHDFAWPRALLCDFVCMRNVGVGVCVCLPRHTVLCLLCELVFLDCVVDVVSPFLLLWRVPADVRRSLSHSHFWSERFSVVYRYYHLLPDLMFKRFCELLWRILNPSSQSDVSQDNIRTGWPLNAHEYPEGYGVAAPPGFCRKRCNCCLSANIGLGVIKASTIPNISFYSLPTGMPQFRLPRTIGFFNHEISRHICHGFALSSIYIVAKSFKQTSLGTGKHTIQVGSFPNEPRLR